VEGGIGKLRTAKHKKTRVVRASGGTDSKLPFDRWDAWNRLEKGRHFRLGSFPSSKLLYGEKRTTKTIRRF